MWPWTCAPTQPATLESHSRVLSALKALSTVGRYLPAVFSEYAAEVTHWVLNDLLEADLSRWAAVLPADGGGLPAAGAQQACLRVGSAPAPVRPDTLPAPLCAACSGKPLRERSALTGRAWDKPSAVVDIKCAALRTLCQALVPQTALALPSEVGGGMDSRMWASCWGAFGAGPLAGACRAEQW